MASLTEVRTALADTLQAALPDAQVYARVPAGPVVCPAIIVQPVRGAASTMNRGEFSYFLTIVVLAAKADMVEAQDVLDAYLAPDGDVSVIEAIHNTKTLGLTDARAHCSGFDEYGRRTIGDQDYLGASLEVQVTTRGNA